jgi:Ca-activated chloride channel homolog
MVAKRSVAACLLLCAFLAAIWAAPAQGQSRAPVILTTKVEVVEVPVIIFDDKGAVATGLKKSDFRLLDDGVPQKILNFDRERVPVSFVIVADLSSSMTGKIPFVQEAALSLIDPEEEDGSGYDEYSVLGIGKRSRELVPFTTDEADLEYRLPMLLTATKESTSLFDGLWLGVATARHEAVNKERAMIVLTDGGDNHSRYSLGETKRLLEEADLPVFAVMAEPSYPLDEFFARREKKRTPFPMGIPSGPGSLGADNGAYIGPAERRGPYNMKTLADASGGGVFTARDDSDLPRIVRTIGLAVRYRYVLSYQPERSEAAKESRERNTVERGTHKIRLELYPKEKFAHYSLPYYKRVYHSIE